MTKKGHGVQTGKLKRKRKDTYGGVRTPGKQPCKQKKERNHRGGGKPRGGGQECQKKKKKKKKKLVTGQWEKDNEDNGDYAQGR